MTQLQSLVLEPDELEALRLVDHLKLQQIEAAKRAWCLSTNSR